VTPAATLASQHAIVEIRLPRSNADELRALLWIPVGFLPTAT
jgi:hypothetical protein